MDGPCKVLNFCAFLLNNFKEAVNAKCMQAIAAYTKLAMRYDFVAQPSEEGSFTYFIMPSVTSCLLAACAEDAPVHVKLTGYLSCADHRSRFMYDQQNLK